MYTVYNGGYPVSENLYANSSGVMEWTDSNPVANNQYQIYAYFTDANGENGMWTWSNLYFVDGAIQKLALAASPLDVFWSEYAANGLEEELTLTL